MKTLIEQLLCDKLGTEVYTLLDLAPIPHNQSGDLALRVFRFAKSANLPPVQAAEQIAAKLCDIPQIRSVDLAGAYVNITFADTFFFEDAFQTPAHLQTYKDENILIEFSSPNTNKPLHLGHMRNHALGVALAGIFETMGATVHRACIVNDRGVHICKSMLAYQKFGNGETPGSTGLKGDHFIGKYYVKYEQAAKEDPSLNEEIQTMLEAWEAGDAETLRLWKQLDTWARDGMQQTYDRQGIAFDKVYLESELYTEGKGYVEEGLRKNILKKREDGAIVLDLTDEGLDEKVLLRPNGTTVYMTQDLATTMHKQKDFQPTRQLWVVADEQNYHFRVLFLCLQKLGLFPADDKSLVHVGYGLVNLPDGRMKSREGNVVDADNLMDELSGIAQAEIMKRAPSLSEQDAHIIAEKIMNAAWKYYLLATSPRKTVTFDAQQSIQFEGATGPYLQYAGVRIQSLFMKAGIAMESLSPDLDTYTALGEAEKLLAAKIREYPHVLQKAAEQYSPTYVTTYLTELAQLWSSYYAQTSILNAESETLKTARLTLAAKVYELLSAGLHSLGIEIPSQM